MEYRPTPRRLRRRERARRRRFLAGAIVAFILTALSAFQLSRPKPVASTGLTTPGPVGASSMLTEPVAVSDALAAPRPAYSYSVVKGGAPTPEALEQAVEGDPVVRTHYANFDLANVRVVRLTKPRTAHVSYRMGNAVYWTRRPVLLNAGELLLTDGAHYARTRCGNQIADVAGVTTDAEPSPAVLDEPLPPIRPFGLTSFFAPFPLVPRGPPRLAFATPSPTAIQLLLADTAGLELLRASASSSSTSIGSTSEGSRTGARASLEGDPADPSIADPSLADPAVIEYAGSFVMRAEDSVLETGISGTNGMAGMAGMAGHDRVVVRRSLDPAALPAHVPLPVPEPAGMLLLATGLAAAAFRRLRAAGR
jgi:hypothetical protein